MDAPHALGQIEKLMQEDCLDQFGKLGEPAKMVSGKAPHDPICTRIDAHCPDLKLVLLLEQSQDWLSKTCPKYESDNAIVQREVLEDWQKEFANRLLGRLKTRVNTTKGPLQLGLPAGLDARHVGVSVESSPCVISQGYQHAGEFNTFHLLIESDMESLQLEENPSSDTDVVDDGELELF